MRGDQERVARVCISSIQLVPGRISFLFTRHSQGVISHPRFLSAPNPDSTKLLPPEQKKRWKKREKSAKRCKWKHLDRDKNDISSVHRRQLMLYYTLLQWTEKQSTLFIPCPSWTFAGLVCKALRRIPCNRWILSFATGDLSKQAAVREVSGALCHTRAHPNAWELQQLRTELGSKWSDYVILFLTCSNWVNWRCFPLRPEEGNNFWHGK